MMDGTLKQLMEDTPLAKELRRHFVFKIVPMLNPDGVVHGNYRCSLLGCDLNRKWLMPNKFLHPTIFYTKFLIRFTHWERKVLFFCDMHGHSRKHNCFFYGCSYKNFEQQGRIKNAQLRILPLLCCHKNPTFSFADSTFKIEKQKESTGRVVVFREYNIMNSFTLECSFHGKQMPDGRV
jgi:cytosolic carboxypeptidase protein 2/3